ncbi:hypothetical protein MP228_007779 [Amoeboaphelidium protococcarum]|nr:hypothetical protein MP228_007779 [Amoeboaphelidium protococcarum]
MNSILPLLKRPLQTTSRIRDGGKGIIESVLYGTKGQKQVGKGQLGNTADEDDVDDDDDRDTTFSKKLARGKYVHELVFHDVKPDKMDEYRKLVADHYPRIAQNKDNQVNLVGSWNTSVGADLDQVVHMWEYKGYTGYDKTMSLLQHDPQYQEYSKQLPKLIRRRQNQMCLEFAFWLTSPPQPAKDTTDIYELRSYMLKAGNLLEWEQQWKRGLEIRKKYCQPVGAWFTQLGALSLVHHMWVYPSLDDRKRQREEAWQEDGWAQTVYNTVPLVKDMRTRILKPMPFSPLK